MQTSICLNQNANENSIISTGCIVSMIANAPWAWFKMVSDLRRYVTHCVIRFTMVTKTLSGEVRRSCPGEVGGP
jgi:hypothetical protein